jgi:regulatory protein
MHFRRELEVKLRKRGYSEEERAAALTKLTTNGFLDDTATARTFVGERLRRGGVGRRKLIAELVKRGVGEGPIEAALEDLPEDDREPARALAERWLMRSTRPQGPKRDAALARHLEGRGFSARAIVAALEALRDDPHR